MQCNPITETNVAYIYRTKSCIAKQYHPPKYIERSEHAETVKNLTNNSISYVGITCLLVSCRLI